MNNEKYLNDRKALMDAAQTALDAGKMDDFKAKTEEVEALDAKYDAACVAQANLNALNDKANKVQDISNQAVMLNGGTVVDTLNKAADNDIYDSAEYKNAFMRNVLFNAKLPEKFQNADANTKTSDVGSVIPTTTMQKIVEKMESIGMILPLVTKTSYKGGLAVPTSSVKPVASWVAEGAGSDKQKKTTGSIVFSYYKLRCAISMSLETTVVTYPMFEAQFVQNVADAMVKAEEQSIITGTGTGQPSGILKETVVTGQNVDVAKANSITYADLVAMEAALPQAYDSNAVWCMTKKTFMGQIIGMVDSQKQPVARVNYGIAGKPEYSIFGRRVVLIGDYMDSYVAAPAADSIVAFIFDFADYVLNTNQAVTVKRYTDETTEDEIVKAIALVDGKVIDKNSLVTLTKKSA